MDLYIDAATVFMKKYMAIQMNVWERDGNLALVSSIISGNMLYHIFIWYLPHILTLRGKQGSDFLGRISIYNVVILNVSKGKDALKPGPKLMIKSRQCDQKDSLY